MELHYKKKAISLRITNLCLVDLKYCYYQNNTNKTRKLTKTHRTKRIKKTKFNKRTKVTDEYNSE